MRVLFKIFAISLVYTLVHSTDERKTYISLSIEQPIGVLWLSDDDGFSFMECEFLKDKSQIDEALQSSGLLAVLATGEYLWETVVNICKDAVNFPRPQPKTYPKNRYLAKTENGVPSSVWYFTDDRTAYYACRILKDNDQIQEELKSPDGLTVHIVPVDKMKKINNYCQKLYVQDEKQRKMPEQTDSNGIETERRVEKYGAMPIFFPGF